VTLLARTAAEAAALEAARENKRHRPGLAFPPSLRVSANPADLGNVLLVVIAVPSQTLAINLESIVLELPRPVTVVSAMKGIEPDKGMRLSEVIAAFDIEPPRILALSGPNFASEIARGLPAATVIAGQSTTRVQEAQSFFNGPTFRVYASDDLVGVELGGALKNVVAIACGLSDGLGYGENAKAGLITRGLAEIARLGVAAGARPLTFLGLAGLGDLVLTCQSDLSRNRRFGIALAKGMSYDNALTAAGGLVEGAITARAVRTLAARFGVEMPVCEELHAVLYEGKSPQDAVRSLMSRAAKSEMEGL
jgi:glycerol-3-phosphate dehydrogenase (NAD(P)+)